MTYIIMEAMDKSIGIVMDIGVDGDIYSYEVWFRG